MLRSWTLIQITACTLALRIPTDALGRRSALGFGLAAAAHAGWPSKVLAEDSEKPKFQRLSPIQFIAALGDPQSSSGSGAGEWGLWREDPGPRGVYLRDFEAKQLSKKPAPAGWKFDPNGWWVEEHGLIMPPPEFPLPARRFQRDGEKMSVVANAKRYVSK